MMNQILQFISHNKIQFVSIAGSIIFLLFIIELIRKRKISEAYSILWLFMGVAFLALSIWRYGLELFSSWIGIAYPPAALLLVMIMSVILILVQVSIIISKHTEKIKTLTQNLALAKIELEKLRNSIEKTKS